MTLASDILQSAEAEVCRPWLRHIVSHANWLLFAHSAAAAGCPLLAHWADTQQAHALWLDYRTLTVIAISTPVEAGRYPALSPAVPIASWYERMIHDLWGHQPEAAADLRPWLDHGHWPQVHPMATRPETQGAPAAPLLFGPDHTSESGRDDTMIMPLGPVWGRLDEAAHLRLTLRGPAIVRAESLLGFSHKGTLTLMRGKSPRAAARFAARLSADTTVAHSVAFALATESAMDVLAPERAIGLRIVMMEIERIAGHLDNLAELGRLAGAPAVHVGCGAIREILLRASEAAFGHRLMMDCVIPGGVAVDIAEGGPQVILRALGEVASRLPAIRRQYAGAALASRLIGVARVGREFAALLGVGGIVGRAAGHPFDLRGTFSPGYATLAPRLIVRADGDAAARQHLRIFEIEESLRLIGAALESLPDGPVTVALPQVSGEGIGCAESVRGDIWHWLRLDHGQIAAAFPRDPGWVLWPLAERVLEQAVADDIELIRTSLGLPASGMDL